MNLILAIFTVVIPQLIKYFKERPVNAVTGAAGGSLITLVLMGMQTGSYDQAITFLQNNGDYGIIAAAVIAGLRAMVQVYSASKPK